MRALTLSLGLYVSTPLIAAALALDLLIGDPRFLPHPVRLIGALVGLGDRRLRSGEPGRDFIAGLLLALGVVALAGALTWAVIAGLDSVAPALGAALALWVSASALALRGLDQAAGRIERAVLKGDDELARRLLPALVGRDPQRLGRIAIIRATVESLAENCSDGVIAPLLFLFIGGPAAAIAYKAVNTLDSMIGYRDGRHLYFGKAAARLDDVANFIPARISALLLTAAAALYLGRGGRALSVCRADARRHESPNAGFPEAAMAGALGIQLGGDAFYEGRLEKRALLGRPERPPAPDDLKTARVLVNLACALGFSVFALLRWAITLL